MLHVKARSEHPRYPPRLAVPDHLVPWSVPWPEYHPPQFTHPNVTNNDRSVKAGGWADPTSVPAAELAARVSYVGRVHMVDGLPRNPVGRTGLRGRGLLGNWGPNHAADPIVTRISPTTGALEMVVIQRVDTKEWAIPGGMVDPGEMVSATLKREFGEEALGNEDPAAQSERRRMLDELFSHEGVEIYRGYVDDPRNTDNAWMETVAMQFHCPPALGAALELEAADDAQGVRWLPIQNNPTELRKLYASHAKFVEEVVRRFEMATGESRRPSLSAKLKHIRTGSEPFLVDSSSHDVSAAGETRGGGWPMALAGLVLLALAIYLIYYLVN